MLIGADAYWSIVQDTVVRGPGLVAVQSKLGYLLRIRPTVQSHNYLYAIWCLSLQFSTPSGEVWEADFVTTNQSSTFLQVYSRLSDMSE